MMKLAVHVPIGQIRVSNGEDEILETFVGSCVALCIYDPYSKVGGMAHIMLPGNNSRNLEVLPDSAKYSDDAIKNLILLLSKKGAKLVRLRAKMAGGANMFFHEEKPSIFNIGQRNIIAIKSCLREYGIPLLFADTGMNYGRNVRLVIKSGEVTVGSRHVSNRKMN